MGRRGAATFALSEKKMIVDEAYALAGNIRPTARKYQVQPTQIRRWKSTIEKAAEGSIKWRNKNHAPLANRPHFDPSLYHHLLEFFA